MRWEVESAQQERKSARKKVSKKESQQERKSARKKVSKKESQQERKSARKKVLGFVAARPR
jgi:hypothetical protein